MDETHIAGTAKKRGAKVEEEFGRATGDTATQLKGAANRMRGAAQDFYGEVLDASSELAGVAAGQRRVCAVLHLRKPCSRKAVRRAELHDPLLVFLPTDQSGRQYRTLPADQYRQFSFLAVAGRQQTTSHCVGEIRSASRQICGEIRKDVCSPASGGAVSTA